METLEKLREIEQAKAILKKHGYYVDNLWHVDDIYQHGKIDEDDAYDVLDAILSNDYVIEIINDMVKFEYEDRNF